MTAAPGAGAGFGEVEFKIAGLPLSDAGIEPAVHFDEVIQLTVDSGKRSERSPAHSEPCQAIPASYFTHSRVVQASFSDSGKPHDENVQDLAGPARIAMLIHKP